MTHVRFRTVSLTEPISPDTSDRNTLGMSTLIDGNEWLIEAEWVNGSIGDVALYRNQHCLNDQRKKDEEDKPLPDLWKWFAGVPAAKVRCYRLHEDTVPVSPSTLIPFPDGKREAKPGPAAAKHAANA